ncbi:helix-turn-helix transcriptional regulator [Rugosimonospora acidiphila]|uniref:helix-turn-helix transcriptional regulator n=1 Tax=Rugosimonospora acidiphila TaxID=556531 RepID=UPI0031EB439B
MTARTPKIALRGRGREQRVLAGLLADATAGHGGALLLSGPVGIGKTALLDEAPAAADRFTVLAADGAGDESGLAFAGLHRLLRPAMNYAAALPPAQARRLARALDGDYPEDDGLALSVAGLGLLCAAARDLPVLCRIDDAHRLDRASLRVLAFAARRVAAERVALLFAAASDEDGTGPLADLPTLRVDALDAAASRQVLADRVAPDSLAGDLAGLLARTAGGNPRALVDLAASLSPEQRRGDAPVPVTLPPESALRRAYKARLAPLPPGTRWLLLLAAADEELDVPELRAAAAASGVDIAALEPAEAAGLLRVTGTALGFDPPLLRGVVYHESSLARRQDAHLLLAGVLDPRRHPVRHVLHRAAAAPGLDDGLARDLIRAARGAAHGPASHALERAAQLSPDAGTATAALLGAARHAWLSGEPHRARVLIRRVRRPDVPDSVRARAVLLTGELELRVGAVTEARHALLAAAGALTGRNQQLAAGALLLAGEALCLGGGHSQYADVAAQALALRHAGEPQGPRPLFAYFSGMAAILRGDYRSASGLLGPVLAQAPALDDPVTLSRMSMAGVLLGDDSLALTLATRSAELGRTTGNAVVVPQALESAAFAQFALGWHDEASASALEGLRLARATGQRNLVENHLGTLAVLAALNGDRDSCLLLLREARAYQGVDGLSQPQAFAQWALALLDLMEGQFQSSVDRLDGLLAIGTGRGNLVVQVAATPHLVEAAARCADRTVPAEAVRIFDLWAAYTGNPTWLALSARCHALLAGGATEAEEYFREALRQHALGPPGFARAHTELLYGRQLRRRRRPAAAREHLRSALETFRVLGADRWTAQATTELRAAGDHVEPRRASADGLLTAQQERIARLVADGATNREVAARLFLSPRTIDHHLRNIFARLGVRSRTELVKLLT